MFFNKMKMIFMAILALSILTTSCDKDDDMAASSMFTVTIENVSQPKDFTQSGIFLIPVGASEGAPLFPGDAYEFTVQSGPHTLPGDGGTRLSFVAMMVQSNDLFFAPDESGIELYDGAGNPIGESVAVDVTDQVLLWDAGTEVNEMTGSPNQKPQQAPTAGDVGIDENGVVTQITNNTDGINTLPSVTEMLKVTIANQGGSEFLVRIENVSNASTITTINGTAPVPISPGVYAVHNSDNPFFTAGQTASEGVEDIAEDGFFQVAEMSAADNTGLIVPLSPGTFAVHEDGTTPYFMAGQADFGEGLEAIAEDGVPTDSEAALAAKAGVVMSGIFNTPIGSNDPAAIGPGGKYEFSFDAEAGHRLSLATMFVQSNDWFYSFAEGGIALFNGDTPVSSDVTSSLFLYDAGTETDEFPGAGLNQVIRQSSGDMGTADSNNTVRQVSNPPAIVPNLSEVIKVTITAQ